MPTKPEVRTILRVVFLVQRLGFHIQLARRVLEEGNNLRIRIRWNYARALCGNDGATLGDLREAEATLEDTERITRRVLGGAHPLRVEMEDDLRRARAALAARVGDDVSSVCEGVAAMTAKGA